MAAMLAVRRPTGSPNLGDVALAWLITKPSDHEIVWHNGGTGGYRSFIGFDPKARVGVVVLSNTFTAAGVDDIGMHLLDSHVPLIQAPKEHKEVTVDPKLYDTYAADTSLRQDSFWRSPAKETGYSHRRPASRSSRFSRKATGTSSLKWWMHRSPLEPRARI